MASQSVVLVANRGEIACRVFQACAEAGLRSVGIVAPGDEAARHVTYAERLERVASYLDVSAIVEACRRSGATLVHPGYGFLSERPAFARALEEAGIGFLGPRAETMEQLGGKIAAKELAARENVPTLPWARVERGGDLKAAARTVGFPLLLKASAGGGGKGMRRVEREGELAAAAESASAEAVAAFGDGTLFLERLVEKPRHIEVQVFGDGQGGAVCVHERECSLQRRHQKVWEEAPAPRLSAATREGLQAAALRLSRAVKYRSAGTVEFLVDASGGFYFLEMNTRLQVEHPVTELVSGVDLVRAQFELALTGRGLGEVSPPRGHAIEVRLYAEDPSQDYIPTPGTVERLRWPTGPGIRVDSGIEEGQTVGTSFDSMLAKIVVHAPTREHAIARLRFALGETVVLGIGTNQAWLLALASHPAVISGEVDTGFLSRERVEPAPTEERLGWLEAARAAGLGRRGAVAASGPAAGPSPWSEVRL